MWFADPFPCGAYPDVKIFRKDLRTCLNPGEIVIADKGYNDERDFSEAEVTGFESYQRAARGRQEGVNDLRKWLRILTVPFPHYKNLHGPGLSAIANITNLCITFEETLYEIGSEKVQCEAK